MSAGDRGGVDETDGPTQIYSPAHLRARSRIGSTLRGKWRLDALLGVGGMAAVYAGTHRNGSRAAVKILHPELTVNQGVRDRFLREGYVANIIGHDGAVRVIDDDVAEDGSFFLVTELLDGENLEERRLRLGGRLEEDEVLSLVDSLLDVLDLAHRAGVVHRDIKPENLFVTRSGQLKVLDFGIASLRTHSSSVRLTGEGTRLGTAAFMSPEQARGLWDEVDGRSDLWATGATMFCVLTGNLVHDGRSTHEVLFKAMTVAAPPLHSLAPGVSPATALVVDRALAFERDKRWRDARHMQEAVRRAYYDRCGTPITTAPKVTVPDTVPDRAMAAAREADAPIAGTTTRPVAQSSAPNGLRFGPTHHTLLLVASIAVGAAVLGVGGGLWVGRMAARPTTAGAPAARPTLDELRSPPTPSASPSVSTGPSVHEAPPVAGIPEIAVADLPSAKPRLFVMAAPGGPPAPQALVHAEAGAPAPRAALSASVSIAADPSASTQHRCDPPFAIDSTTGRLQFKKECIEADLEDGGPAHVLDDLRAIGGRK